MSPGVTGDDPGLGAAPAPLRGVHIAPCLSFLTRDREQGLKPSFVRSVSSLGCCLYSRPRSRGKRWLEMRRAELSCRVSVRFSAGLAAAWPVFPQQAVLPGGS